LYAIALPTSTSVTRTFDAPIAHAPPSSGAAVMLLAEVLLPPPLPEPPPLVVDDAPRDVFAPLLPEPEEFRAPVLLVLPEGDVDDDVPHPSAHATDTKTEKIYGRRWATRSIAMK
jgi:hypothetical protein